MSEEQAAYDEVYAYTMTQGRANFILQHVVDAHMAQTATALTKPLGITLALIGLYLHVEEGFSGLRVQQVHMRLGKEKRSWKTIPLPIDRGNVTTADVLAAPAGPERNAAIDAWCASVWEAYSKSTRALIVGILQQAHMPGC